MRSLANIDDLKISPKYTVADWKKLNLRNGVGTDWQTASDIFLDRMNGRFVAPVEAIMNHRDFAVAEFSGFAILAIDCLLIETLWQFQNGLDETARGTHRDSFAAVLRNSPHFKTEFDSDDKAKLFYEHFRCGILHQAQTKKRSIVRYGESRMVQLADSTDLQQGLIIDRNLFHKALIQELRDYSSAIVSDITQDGNNRRDKFVRKWDFIIA